MTNPNIDDYEEQEKELLKKLAEIREAKERAIRLAPIKVHIEGVEYRSGTKDAEVHIIADFRRDLLDLYQTIRTRRFGGFGNNWIGIKEWEKFYSSLQKLPNIEITWKDDSRDEIEGVLNQPAWTIKLDKFHLRLYPGPGHDYYDIYRLPKLEYVSVLNAYYKVPLSEGWRLWGHLQDVEKVKWDDDAAKFVIEQLEKRELLDRIAMADDWDYDVAFNDPNVTPRKHQKVAMAFAEATDYRCLISYDTGLGKTIISTGIAHKHNFRTIVFCPAALKPKWCKEIERLTGIKPIVLIGTSPTAFDMKNMIMEKHQYYVANYDTISRSFMNKKEWEDAKGKHVEHQERFLWMDVINMAQFDLAIIDESHYIKNDESGRSKAISLLKTPRIIELTATPVLNRASEYQPGLALLQPDLFGVKKQFIENYTGSPGNLDSLKEVLRPIMIRRRHDDVYKDAPKLNVMERFHDLSPKARKLYQKIEDGIYTKMVELEAKRDSFEPTSQEIPNVLAKIGRLKQVCAIDKVDATAELAFELNDNAVESGSKYTKVLIFSQFKAVAYAIAQRLGQEAMCTISRGEEFYSMGPAERQSLIDKFQVDPSYKYFVTTTAAKEGHDITAAGFVIFNDLFWTPALHDQCNGRAYLRENDPHGIDSYYQIITSGNNDSVEEWIWELLDMKKELIGSAVDGLEASRDISVASELIKKFRENVTTRRKR